jgi:hypothetical protein
MRSGRVRMGGGLMRRRARSATAAGQCARNEARKSRKSMAYLAKIGIFQCPSRRKPVFGQYFVDILAITTERSSPCAAKNLSHPTCD